LKGKRANSRNIEDSRKARRGPTSTDPDAHDVSLADQRTKHYTSAQVINDANNFETDPDECVKVAPKDDPPTEEEEEDEDMKEVINILHKQVILKTNEVSDVKKELD